MKRGWIAGIIIVGVLLIGSASYFGFQSTRVEEKAPEEIGAPPTVEVDQGEVKRSIIAPGILTNMSETTSTAAMSGVIEDVFVQPGDSVKKGDLLLRFRNESQLERNLAEAELSLTIAQSTLRSLYDNLALAQADAQLAVIKAQENLKEKTTDRERMSYPRCSQETIDSYYLDYQDAQKALAELISASASRDVLNQVESRKDTAYANYVYCTAPRETAELAAADAEIALAQASLESKQANLATLAKGPDPVEIARAELALSQAEREVENAKAELVAVELRAPMDGVILAVNARAGSGVSMDTELVTMANPLALEAVISVQEEDYPLISPGQPVELFFEAKPELLVTGEVVRLVPKRVSTDRPLYAVYIALVGVPDKLVEGMTVDATIVLDSRENTVRLPRAVAHVNSEGKATVQVWKGNRTVEREILVGLRGDVYVEILEGLKPGDLVVSQ